MNNQSKTKRTDREKMRLRSLAQVFNKTNRILTGNRSIVVGYANPNNPTHLSFIKRGVPGWSSFPHIVINADAFSNFKEARTLVALLGLNYHELSHLMFTPRLNEFRPHQQMAFNILEDQRIESFFTARYQPAGKYFTEMVVRFYVEDQEAWSSAFMFTYGRSFLPLEIRQEFEDRFALPHRVDEVKDLINKYKAFRSYHFKSRPRMVHAVISRFHEILEELNGETGRDFSNSGNDCQSVQNDGEVDKDAEKDAQQKDRRRQEKEEKTGEDQSGFWEEEEDEEDGASGESDGDNEESEHSPTEDDDEGQGDSGESEVDDDADSSDGDDSGSDGGDEQSDEGSGDEDGNSGGDSGSEDSVDDDPDDGEEMGRGQGGSGIFEDDHDFEDYLQDVVDAVEEDDDVRGEVQNIKASMDDLGNIDVIDFGKSTYTEEIPSPIASASLNKVAQEYRRLYAEVEPGWLYGSNVGRLNVDRAMRDPDNYEEMFDEWDEGREHEVGLEVVIACDLSGSMGARLNYNEPTTLVDRASEALWVIKRALDEVDAKVTVLGFHQSTFGLFSRDEKANKTFWPRWTDLGGDTLPAQSMVLARRILTTSSMPNKLFIIITDGQLGTMNPETFKQENLGELMDTIPGHKMYVGLGSAPSYAGYGNSDVTQRCDVSTNIQDPSGLVILTKNLVTKMLLARRR